MRLCWHKWKEMGNNKSPSRIVYWLEWVHSDLEHPIHFKPMQEYHIITHYECFKCGKNKTKERYTVQYEKSLL